jgi:hypothetical protein
VNAVGKAHHDRRDDQGQHRQPERGIAHVFSMPPRWCAASSMSCACSIAMRRDSSSTNSLCANCSPDDVDLFHVRRALGPFAGADADHAADHLGEALQIDEHARDRDHHLELVDRGPIGGHVGMLVDAPRVAGEAQPA